MSQQQDIQERIAAARREAETLKEKIRAKKEASADTSCESVVYTLCFAKSSLILPRSSARYGG